MNIATRTRQSNIWVFIGLMFTVMRFSEYFFYGKHVHDLIAGIGFILVTIGAYLNGFQTLEAITNSGKKSVISGYAFALVGVSLAIASMVIEHSA